MKYYSTNEKIFEIGYKFYLTDLSFILIHGRFGDHEALNNSIIEDELLKGHPFVVVSEPYEVRRYRYAYDDYDYSKCNGICIEYEYRIDVMICDCEDMPVLSLLNQRENIIEDYESYKNIIEELDFELLGGVL